jgi:hypothetical protein
MSADQDRWQRLIACDVHAQAFVADARQSAEMGDVIAETDISRLWRLSERVARALGAWRRDIARLELARGPIVPQRRAARLISEGLFDEALTPLAYAVFDAALDLALDGPPGSPRLLSRRPL